MSQIRAQGWTSDKEKRPKGDLYKTPKRAVLPAIELMLQQGTNKKIWEPAVGTGNIAQPLKEAGFSVVSTDITNHGYKGTKVQDFLTTKKTQAPVIMTNPPFSHANEFARHALALSDVEEVWLFLRLGFVTGKKRTDITDDPRFSAMHIFRLRVAMNLDIVNQEKPGGGVDYAWFVWKKDHKGPKVFSIIKS